MENQELIKTEESNITIVDNKLKDLIQFVDNKDFKKFWDAVTETNGFINNADPLARDTKNEFRTKINALCIKAKEEQQIVHALAKEENKKNSAATAEIIMNMVKEALALPITGEGIKEAIDKIEKAQQALRIGRMNDMEINMSREDKDICWAAVKEAKDEAYKRKGELKNINFKLILERVYKAEEIVRNGDPYDAMEAIKAIRNDKRDMAMDSEHYDKINKYLNDFWDIAVKKIEAKRSEKAEKHKQWRSDMENKIHYLGNLIVKNTLYIQELEVQVEELTDKLPTTHSTLHQEKLETWIAEKKQKIADIQTSNADIEFKVEDIKRKLAE